MNERIRELAEQAGFSSGAMINIGTGEAEELWIRYNENEDREEFPNSKMMQKFAELIVQECIHAVEDTNDRYRKEYFANQIRNRFGVK